MTVIEPAGYIARRMVAEGYSESDAIDAEAMLLRHLVACRKRDALSSCSHTEQYATRPSATDGESA